jgi:hypothetical protein
MADDVLIAEELERVYRLYGGQLQTFRRALYSLLTLGAVVFALIVVPFLGLDVRVDQLEQRQRALAEQSRQAEAALAEVERLQGFITILEEFSQLREWEQNDDLLAEAETMEPRILGLRERYADDRDPGVRDWAAGRSSMPPETSVLMAAPRRLGTRHDCDFRLDGTERGRTDYAACRTCELFQAQSRKLAGLIGRLPEDVVVASGAREVDAVMLAKRACSWLVEGETHWYRNEPRPDEPWALRGLFTWDIKAYEDVIQPIGREVSTRYQTIRSKIDSFKLSLETARAESEEVAEQLDRVATFDKLATPIGNVPITLMQIVLLFPSVIAAGFLIVANSFGRLATLRSALTRLLEKRGTEAAIADEFHIEVIAPLWFDRGDGVFARGAKWGGIMVPTALMLGSFWLIFRAGVLSDEYPPGSPISSLGYLCLYGISTALVLGAILHIWQAHMRPRGA